MNQKHLIVLCTSLMIMMHFGLPYAAIAEIRAVEHAPPSGHDHRESNHERLHELPHHIEVEQSELEELDQEASSRTPHTHQVAYTNEKTPQQAVFVYLKADQTKTGILHEASMCHFLCHDFSFTNNEFLSIIVKTSHFCRVLFIHAGVV